MSDLRVPNELEARLSRSLRALAAVPGPGVADRVLRATGDVPQRRGWIHLRMAPVLAAAAVVVLAVAVGLGLGRVLGPDITGTPDGSHAPTVTQAPSPSPTATPTIAPTPSGTPEPFPGGSRCENAELGYAVAYPADWYANEEVRPDDEALDPVPACQYFGEEPMEILPNAGIPPSAAISFSLEAGAPSRSGTVLRSELVTIAGRPAELREVEGDGEAPLFREGDRAYMYLVDLPSGDVLIVHTDSTRTGDYDAHQDVLDRMMQLLELMGR